jgi:hypothetical protein
VAWSLAGASNNSGTSAVPSVAKPTGMSAGDLVFAVVWSPNQVTQWPTDWIEDGRGQSAAGGGVTWGHKQAQTLEPSTYTWAVPSCAWIVLAQAFHGVTFDPANCVDAWQLSALTASASTFPFPRPTLAVANDLVLYCFDDGIASFAMTAGPVLVQNTGGGDAVWFENVAGTGQIAARTVNLGSAQTNRTGFVASYASFTPPTPAVHTLSGSGLQAISSPVALTVALSGIPAGLSTGLGNPLRYFGLGSLSWGNTLGYMRNYFLEHANELVLAPFSDATSLGYSFAPGITATVTERQSL